MHDRNPLTYVFKTLSFSAHMDVYANVQKDLECWKSHFEGDKWNHWGIRVLLSYT